jgi:protein associated with RNAse G/E
VTNEIGRPIHVVSTKYDGSPHWEFDSFFVLEQGSLLIATNFAGQVLHNKAGEWPTPFDVRNHFWQDRWYNVMRCDKPRRGRSEASTARDRPESDRDGELAHSTSKSSLEYYYCNVTTPALYDGENVRYVDLDLDVRVHADGRIELLDEDEFVENSQRMGYPPEVIDQARRAADELVGLAAKRAFPFQDLSG